MLFAATLVAETSFPQQGGLAYPLKASTGYVFNTNRVKHIKVWNSSQSEFDYIFHPGSDHSSYATFRCTSTAGAVQTIAKASYTNRFISLVVIKDADGSVVASEARLFNTDHIVLIGLSKTGETFVVYNDGGSSEQTFIVSDTQSAIVTKEHS